MADWIERFIDSAGVLGISLLMFLENLFPPIPSELILPLAGYTAARGETSLVLVVLAALAGSLAGALFWYGIGRLFQPEWVKRFADRHGRWITLSRSDLERTDAWFRKHGRWAVLFGRLVPTVRTLISIPAGFSRMPLHSFLLYSFLGTMAWTLFLTLAGFWLGGRHDVVERWVDPFSYAVIALVVGVYLWRFFRYGRTHRDP